MNFQGVVMNVADLDRSIDFYHEALDFTLVSRKEQLAGHECSRQRQSSDHRAASAREQPACRRRPHRDASLPVGSRDGR